MTVSRSASTDSISGAFLDRPYGNNKIILTWKHIIILTLTMLINSLYYKVWYAFSGFLHDDFNVSYSSLSYIVAIGSCGGLLTFPITPIMSSHGSNKLLFIFEIIISLCIVLNYYFISFSSLLITRFIYVGLFQCIWVYTNSMIANYVSRYNSKISNKYLTIFNACWTFATFIFLPTGYILQYLGFKLFIYLATIITLIFSIVILFTFPKYSINSYNMNNSMINSSKKVMTYQTFDVNDSSNTTTANSSEYVFNKENKRNSLLFQFKFLLTNKLTILTFFSGFIYLIAWGIVFQTFGPYIQVLYNKTESELGIITTLVEGIGESIVILSISYVTIHILNVEYYCLICSIIEVLVIIVWLIINLLFPNYLTSNPNSSNVIYVLFVLFFFGNEGLFIGLVQLLVNVITPKLYQSLASSIWAVIILISGSIGQLLVGSIYVKSNPLTLKYLLYICFLSQIINFINLLVLCYYVKRYRNKILEEV